MANIKFSDLYADPTTVLAALASGDMVLVWDVSETDSTKKIKVANREVVLAPAYAADAVLDGRIAALEAGAFAIPFIFGDGVNVISAGALIDLPVPVDCTIVGYSLFSRIQGSITFDLWKDTYANYPPTVDDTIIDTGGGGVKPLLSNAKKNQVLTPAHWTVDCTAGDILTAQVDSAASVKQVTLLLHMLKA